MLVLLVYMLKNLHVCQILLGGPESSVPNPTPNHYISWVRVFFIESAQSLQSPPSPNAMPSQIYLHSTFVSEYYTLRWDIYHISTKIDSVV